VITLAECAFVSHFICSCPASGLIPFLPFHTRRVVVRTSHGDADGRSHKLLAVVFGQRRLQWPQVQGWHPWREVTEQSNASPTVGISLGLCSPSFQTVTLQPDILAGISCVLSTHVIVCN
jgi:hypothetical protein